MTSLFCILSVPCRSTGSSEHGFVAELAMVNWVGRLKMRLSGKTMNAFCR